MFENIWLTLVELNGHNSEHMCEAMPVVGHIIAGRDDRWARSKVQAAPNSSTKLSHLPRPTTALTRNGRVAMYGSGCVSRIPLQPRHFVTQPAPPGQANLTGRDARSAN